LNIFFKVFTVFKVVTYPKLCRVWL
jgi:hypothetical protein